MYVYPEKIKVTGGAGSKGNAKRVRFLCITTPSDMLTFLWFSKPENHNDIG